MKKNPFSLFNVNEFKKWMEDSSTFLNESNQQSTIGLNVVSKVSFKKLKSVSEVLDNKKAVMEFHKNGGTIIEEDSGVITVKTEKGSIKLNKIYAIIN